MRYAIALGSLMLFGTSACGGTAEDAQEEASSLDKKHIKIVGKLALGDFNGGSTKGTTTDYQAFSFEVVDEKEEFANFYLDSESTLEVVLLDATFKVIGKGKQTDSYGGGNGRPKNRFEIPSFSFPKKGRYYVAARAKVPDPYTFLSAHGSYDLSRSTQTSFDCETTKPVLDSEKDQEAFTFALAFLNHAKLPATFVSQNANEDVLTTDGTKNRAEFPLASYINARPYLNVKSDRLVVGGDSSDDNPHLFQTEVTLLKSKGYKSGTFALWGDYVEGSSPVTCKVTTKRPSPGHE